MYCIYMEVKCKMLTTDIILLTKNAKKSSKEIHGEYKQEKT